MFLSPHWSIYSKKEKKTINNGQNHSLLDTIQATITCSKLTIEILGQGVKYAQS